MLNKCESYIIADLKYCENEKRWILIDKCGKRLNEYVALSGYIFLKGEEGAMYFGGRLKNKPKPHIVLDFDCIYLEKNAVYEIIIEYFNYYEELHYYESYLNRLSEEDLFEDDTVPF